MFERRSRSRMALVPGLRERTDDLFTYRGALHAIARIGQQLSDRRTFSAAHGI